MSTSWQEAVLDAVQHEALGITGRTYRVLRTGSYANEGVLWVVQQNWDEVAHLRYSFPGRNATLTINADLDRMHAGPSSPTLFHLAPSDGAETRRMLAAWGRILREHNRT